MEMEYKDTNRRGKFVIIVGVVLAVVAGGAAFYLIQQAQQTAGQGEATLVDVVVAAQNIPARTPILPGAVEKKKVPLDEETQVGIVSDPTQLTGKVLAISVAKGQPIYSNMLATSVGQTGFSIHSLRQQAHRVRSVSSRSMMRLPPSARSSASGRGRWLIGSTPTAGPVAAELRRR